MERKKPHDYMEQCPYCRKYLLAKQVKTHVCDTSLREVKEIPVVFFYESVNDEKEKLIMARGYDGILYRLVKCKNPISSDDGYHEPQNRRRVNRTFPQLGIDVLAAPATAATT